jgi:hypothetical protein
MSRPMEQLPVSIEDGVAVRSELLYRTVLGTGRWRSDPIVLRMAW